MKGLILSFAAVVAMGAAGASPEATVGIAVRPPVIDGRLDDACWKDGWTDGFRLKKNANRQPITDRCSYRLASDGENVYFAFRVKTDRMSAVRAWGRKDGELRSGMWVCDTVELFLAPTGVPDDFYQFAVDFQGKRKFAQFWGESGHISPDPFDPEWRVEVGDLGDGWCVEAEIPLSSLYMTRNRDWKTEWLVNVGYCSYSTRHVLHVSDGTRINESKCFAKIGGFPRRADGDDFAATELRAAFDEVSDDGVIGGTLTMKVHTGVSGTYAFRSKYAKGEQAIDLKQGDNVVKVRCAYPEKGRFATDLAFVRKADGRRYLRSYPVFVEFEPIMVTFAKPGYRNNFYPGQDASEVSGKVRIAGDAKATLTLEGPGFAKQTAEPGPDGAFRFDTRGFATGEAYLTVRTAKEAKRVRIRNLPPTGRWMSWVENKRLVVNGKPGFKACVSAPHYMGGTALDEKYDADYYFARKDLSCFIGCEPARLVKGIEQREAIRDVKPRDEVFRKIDEVIEANRDKDFTGYYLCDEPECRNVSPVYLQHLYEYIAERDPYHVVRIASRTAANYFRACDLAESHDYLNLFVDENGRRDWRVTPAMIADRIAGHAAAQTPDKVLGCYGTAFAYLWQSYSNDYPTFDEYLSATFAGLVNGAKSMQVYAYHDFADRPSTYYGYQYVNACVAGLEDLLLSDGETLLKTKDCQCVRFAANGQTCFVLVNFTRDPQKAEVPGLAGRYFEYRGDRIFDLLPSSSAFDLRPLEVLIATSLKRGTDLPSRAAVAAKIDRLECERTHRDNQLFWHPGDIDFETPGMKRFVTSTYKFIDGTRDVIGGFWEGGTNYVVGMTFKNGLRPRFDTVRVYGLGVGGLEVDVPDGDGLRTLRPAARRIGRYECELTFGAAVTVEQMRLRFTHPKRGANRTELYEIELPHVVMQR